MEKRSFIRYPILFLLCIIFGIADYYMCDLVVYVLKFPIFCDMIFCMAMTFFAGPIWGILVVIFDHLFDMALSHVFVIEQLYTISAIIGCVVAWLYKKFCIKDSDSVLITVAQFLLFILILTIVMSITGGIISRIVASIRADGSEYTYQTEFLKLIFGGKLMLPWLDAILLRLPVNLADRLITVFAGWGIYLGMSKIENTIVCKRTK